LAPHKCKARNSFAAYDQDNNPSDKWDDDVTYFPWGRE
jgi:hypothetical protein